MDPISLAIMGGGKVLDFIGQRNARKQQERMQQQQFEEQMRQFQKQLETRQTERGQDAARQDAATVRNDRNTASQNAREDSRINSNQSREDSRINSNQFREDSRMNFLDNRADQDRAEERQINADAVNLSKSSRTDAYGNTVRFVEGRGWVTELTPMQRAIMDGQQNEQLNSLREDAPRQRAAAERQDNRSKSANSVFEDLMVEYGNLNRPTQQSEESRNVLRALEERKSGPQSDQFLNQALRTGATPRTQDRGTTLAGAIMDAKAQGGKDFIENDKAMVGKTLNEAEAFRAMADGTTSNPIDTATNQSNALGGMTEQGLSTLVQSIMAGKGPRGNAGMVASSGGVGAGSNVGNNYVNSSAGNIGGMAYPNMPTNQNTGPSYTPLFGELGQLIAQSMQTNKDTKRSQAVEDRNYGLDYYNSTGQFPS
jgi:hypothetical protein